MVAEPRAGLEKTAQTRGWVLPIELVYTMFRCLNPAGHLSESLQSPITRHSKVDTAHISQVGCVPITCIE